MQSVTYLKGRAKFRRVFRVSDLDRLSIPHKGEDLVFSADNRFTIVMSNKMSESFVAAFPKEFKAYPAEGDDESHELEVKDPLISLTESSHDEPEGLLDASVEPENDDSKSTKRDRKTGS